MKTSVLSALFCRYSLEHAFESVSRAGYDGIDLSGARPHAYPYDMDLKRIDKVLKLKEKYQLEIPMYGPDVLAYPYNLASQLPAERADGVKFVDRAIDVAAEMGIPKVQITCGHTCNNTTRRENLDNLYSSLEPLVQKAQDRRVVIILEAVTIMESNVVVFVDDIKEVLDHFHSPYLKTMMDTVTPPINKETYAEHFEKLGHDIQHIHFVDCNGTDQTHMLLGTGVIDLPALRDTILHYGYDGWLCSEIISQGIMEPDLCAAREIRKMKELFHLK